MRPRPCHRGETLTVAWLIAQFKAAGLKPAGDTVKGVRGWTQDVPLRHARFRHAHQISAGGIGPLVQRQESHCARRRMAARRWR
jgi:hypothetical protein